MIVTSIEILQQRLLITLSRLFYVSAAESKILFRKKIQIKNSIFIFQIRNAKLRIEKQNYLPLVAGGQCEKLSFLVHRSHWVPVAGARIKTMAAVARLTVRLAVAAARVQEVVDHHELLTESLASRLRLTQVLPDFFTSIQNIHGPWKLIFMRFKELIWLIFLIVICFHKNALL